MSLLKATIVKNSHSFGPIYIIFLKQRPEPDLKVFQYRIWTSVKGSEKYLSSKRKI